MLRVLHLITFSDHSNSPTRNIRYLKCVHISEACNGTGATLSGDEGLIWMNVPLYTNNAYCQWQIKVAFGKVSLVNVPLDISLNTSSFETWS